MAWGRPGTRGDDLMNKVVLETNLTSIKNLNFNCKHTEMASEIRVLVKMDDNGNSHKSPNMVISKD